MPASRSRVVSVASYGETQPSRIFDPQVVGMSVVVNTSLSASGTPASADAGAFPAASESSTAWAAVSACSPATCRKALSSPSTAAIRSRCAWVTSTEDTSRAWIFDARTEASNAVRSAVTALLPGSAALRNGPARRPGRPRAPAPGSGRAR